MDVEIRPIPPTKDELTKFVKFGNTLYKGNKYYVPPIIFDDVNTLNPNKNPAFEHCDAQSFMAYRDGKPVGRITAIINHQVNKRTGEKNMRWGFLEFIDDKDVVDALFKAVERWGVLRGMTHMVGPMGFTDLDHEGMLIEGFDYLGTMPTIYNHPYYPRHMERLGMKKEVDWVEFRLDVPDKVPDKMQRIANIVSEKYHLRCLHYKSRKKLKDDYGKALFKLINIAYDGLYGFSPLTEKQINYYIDQYLGMLRLDNISIVVDDCDKLVAVGITMPSLSRALQKSGGSLFPTGWYHLLQALRGKTDRVDLMLVAVDPEYQNKGVNAMLFADLIPTYIRLGYRYAETNLELEANSNVQKQWEYFTRIQHRRRRCYKKALNQNLKDTPKIKKKKTQKI